MAPPRTATDDYFEAAAGDRVERLFCIRESALYAMGLLLAMLIQTAAPYRHIDGVEDAIKAGIGPLKNPRRFGALVLREGRTRLVLYRFGSSWFALSLGSAAARNGSSGDNAFCHMLAEVIVNLRPKDLIVSTFSRLVRSHEFSGTIYKAVVDNVDRVLAGSMEVDLRTQFGPAQWSFLAMFSAMERDEIVRRLLIGILVNGAAGRWLRGPNLPPFFELDEDGRARFIAGAEGRCALMLSILASKAEDRVLLDQLSELGMTSVTVGRVQRQSRRRRAEAAADALADAVDAIGTVAVDDTSVTDAGFADFVSEDTEATPSAVASEDDREADFETATNGIDDVAGGASSLAEAQQAGPLVKRLRLWAVSGAFENGSFALRWKNPISGITELAGYPVSYAPPGSEDAKRFPHGFFTIPYQWTIPPLDVEPDVFDSIRCRLAERVVRGSSDDVTKPLSNFAVVGDAKVSRKLMSVGNTYVLYERPSNGLPSTPGKEPFLMGWRGDPTAKEIATIRARRLHESVAATFADAIQHGVAARELDGIRVLRNAKGRVSTRNVQADRRTALLERMESAGKAAENAVALAAHAKSPLVQAQFAALAESEAKAHEEASAELAVLEAAPEASQKGRISGGFQAEVNLVAVALAKLATTDSVAPSEVNDALADLIDFHSFEVDGLFVTWTASLQVDCDGHVVVLGPVSDVVPNRASKRTWPQRPEGFASAVLRDGVPPDALADFVESETPHRVNVLVAEWLQGDGRSHPGGPTTTRAAGMAIMRHPHPIVRSTLWAAICGDRVPECVTDEFATRLLTTYCDPNFKTSGKLDSAAGRYLSRVVAELERRGGFASIGELTGADANRQHGVARIVAATKPSARQPLPILVATGSWANTGRSGAARTVALRRCATVGCSGWLSTSIALPEVAGALACRSCHRDSAGLLLPADYFARSRGRRA